MKLFILFSATIILLQACTGKAMEKQASPTDLIAVKLMPVSREDGAVSIHAAGLLATEKEAHLSFKVSGIIENVLVKEGQLVKKGQLLATIKPTEIAAQVQQVKLSIEKAQRDYERVLNLYKDSVATLEQLQNAKTGLDIARQTYQQVSFNEQYSKIYAPADGFIVAKPGNTGELAYAGMPVLTMNALGHDSKWILKAGVPDVEWAVIETGNKAVVHFDAFRGKTFPATVSKKSLAADPVSGSFVIELKVSFGTVLPAAGMFGAATIFLKQAPNNFSIPYEALLEANGKQGFVFVSDDKKTVKKIPVSIGEIKENTVTITDGLQGHSYIVTTGSPYLTDNTPITTLR